MANRSSTGRSGRRESRGRPAAGRDLRDHVSGGQAGVIGGRAGAHARDGGAPVDHAHGEPGIADAVLRDRGRRSGRLGGGRGRGTGGRGWGPGGGFAGRRHLLDVVVFLGAGADDQHVRLAELAHHLVRHPVERGVGRRGERERLVPGAHGFPVHAAQRLVVVLVAHGLARRRPGSPGAGRCARRPGSPAWRASRPRTAAARRRGARGRARARPPLGGGGAGAAQPSPSSAGASANRTASAASVDASARPAAAPARSAAAVPRTR